MTPCAVEQRRARGALLLREREQQVLGGDVGVAQLLGLLLGAVEDPVQLAAEASAPPLARLLREAGDLALDRLAAAR